MKYFLIAGEASGDLHGSNLMKSLLKKDSEAVFAFWGGDKMQTVSDNLKKHINELAFMGFIEVLMNIITIFKNFKLCKQQIEEFKPDALILIDYPGFNLRIAEFAKGKKIPVHYYISPQIWAWKQNRVYKIKKVVDTMYTILPFEKKFYDQFNYNVQYVGHPLVDAIREFKTKALSNNAFRKKYNLIDGSILAILPGSRNQEIKKKLPIMLKAAESFPDFHVVIAGAPNKDASFYRNFVPNNTIKIIENDTYNLLKHSNLAIVTSGTATLETALFKVPQVVCYKASSISYQIAKQLVKVKYISLVNLIMDRLVVTELIQSNLTAENIVFELKKNQSENATIQSFYNTLEKLLGEGGASEKVAKLIYDNIQ